MRPEDGENQTREETTGGEGESRDTTQPGVRQERRTTRRRNDDIYRERRPTQRAGKRKTRARQARGERALQAYRGRRTASGGQFRSCNLVRLYCAQRERERERERNILLARDTENSVQTTDNAQKEQTLDQSFQRRQGCGLRPKLAVEGLEVESCGGPRMRLM